MARIQEIIDPEAAIAMLEKVKRYAGGLVTIAASHGVVLTIERELDPLNMREYRMKIETRLTRDAQEKIK